MQCVIIDTMKFTNKIIRNIEFPSCKNCVHFRPSSWSNDFADPLSKCEKLGTKDVVTDKITFQYADSCRIDENLCGKSGNYFEKEPRLILKKLKHKIFRPITLFYSIPVVYLVAYYIKFMI